MILSFWLSAAPVLADDQNQSYKVYLFYDATTQELRADRFVDNPVELISEQDVLTYDDRVTYAPESPMYVQLSSNVYDFPDTLKYERVNGAFTILVPYYPHVRLIKISLEEDSQGFSLPVESFSQCNQNQVCELEFGEDATTCLADCSGESVEYSDSTQESLQQNQGVIQDQEGTVLLDATAAQTPSESSTQDDPSTEGSNYLYLLGGIVLIAGALGGWVLVHFRR